MVEIEGINTEKSAGGVIESLLENPRRTETVLRKLVDSSYWNKHDIDLARADSDGRVRYPRASIYTEEESVVPRALPIVTEIFIQQQPWAASYIDGRESGGAQVQVDKIRKSVQTLFKILDSISDI